MFEEIIKNLDLTKIILALIALLGTGIFIGVQKHNKQTQKSGDNSKNYQANGDLTIVNHQYTLAEEQAYKICREIVENNIIKFSGDAIETAKQKFKEFADLYVEKITNQEDDVVEKITERLKDPSMQYAIFEAQKGYTKFGNKEKAENLCKLLIEKGKETPESLMDIIIDDAIIAVAKLNQKQIDFLSYLVYKRITVSDVNNINSLYEKHIKDILLYTYTLDLSYPNFEYLSQIGCITKSNIKTSGNELLSSLKFNYHNIFSKGFTQEEFIKSLDKAYLKYTSICINNDDLLQINIPTEHDFKNIMKNNNIPNDINQKLWIFFNKIFTDEEITQKFCELNSNISNIINKDQNLPNVSLTPVGTLIAIKNIELKTGQIIDWDFN